LQEVGEIMHIASSGRVIVKLSQDTNHEKILCDEKGVRLARISELIGPVSMPYASATSLTNNIKKFVGKKVFVLETSSVKNKKVGRR
tara:strand:- start:232 stop:492 length:261 start_codon:yes stop_codon:yes gene_type:complete